MLTREVTPPRSYLPAILLGLVSCWLAVMLAAGMMLLLSGCAQVKEVGGEIGGHVAEWIACPTDLVDCGHVYQCSGTVNTDPHSWGYVEICIDDDDQPGQLDEIEALYHDCELTPRHEGLCIYCCGPDCGRGANAFNGAYCP